MTQTLQPSSKEMQVGAEFAFRAGEAEAGEVAFHQRHDRLALGISEAAVVFDDLRAGGREHQAEVEESAVGQAFLAESGDGGPDDLVFDARERFRRNELSAGDGAHAAGVRAAVAIQRALVVAGGRENQVVVIDDRGENRDFRAGQALLDEHPPGAEAPLGENLVEKCHGRRLHPGKPPRPCRRRARRT